MKFNISHTDGAARRGRLQFGRGVVDTPAFMPVGTYGTVKAMTPEELTGLGAQIILGNTFHLWLRPGMEIMRAHGGLHGFMHWDAPSSPTPAVSRCSAWATCARSPSRV